jgi:hypothetical protein
VAEFGSIGVVHTSIDIKRKVLCGGVWSWGGHDRGTDLASIQFGRRWVAMEGMDVDCEIGRSSPR